LSKFVPQKVGGVFVMVRGIIYYNYLADRLNWLELGFAFTSQTNLYSSKFESYLPMGSEEER